MTFKEGEQRGLLDKNYFRARRRWDTNVSRLAARVHTPVRVRRIVAKRFSCSRVLDCDARYLINKQTVEKKIKKRRTKLYAVSDCCNKHFRTRLLPGAHATLMGESRSRIDLFARV